MISDNVHWICRACLAEWFTDEHERDPDQCVECGRTDAIDIVFEDDAAEADDETEDDSR